MRELKRIFYCAGTNFRKWYKNPAIWMIALLWLILLLENNLGLPMFCLKNGYTITPWLLPFSMINYTTLFMMVLVLTVLFAQAPFCDVSVPFTMVRTGKRAWFLGQVLYIIGAALLFTLYTCACLGLLVAPCAGFSMDWGGVLRGLATDPGQFQDGYAMALSISPQIIARYTPLEATTHSFLLIWLTAVLVGCTILFFNVVFRHGLGVIFAILLMCWTYATEFNRSGQIGRLGAWLKATNIYHWCSLTHLAPIDVKGMPLPQAVMIDLLLIAVMIVWSMIYFCRKDTLFEKNQF